MKHITSRRWFWIIGSAVVLLVVGTYLGLNWLEHQVLKRSERILNELSGPGSSISFGSVDIHPFQGAIRWSGLRIGQPAEDPDTAMGDRPMRVSGRVREIAVDGLSIWRLLFAGSMDMRSITVSHPELEVILMNDSRTVAEGDPVDLSSLNADLVVLENAMFRVRRTGDSAVLHVDTLGVQLTDLRSQWGGGEPFDLRFATAAGRVRGIRARLPPLYDLHAAALDLDQDGRALRVTDVSLVPRKEPQQFQEMVKIETDLYDLHMDTAVIQGLDLFTLINVHALNMTSLRIAGVDLDVYRDKTMPAAPVRHKALPARMVRQLPFALCMDSLVVDRWNVGYHERSGLSPEYGQVSFNDIRGVVRGLCSADTLSTDTLEVRVSARGYDQASINLLFRTVIADRSDRFTAHATVSGLSFKAFNQMTADLLLVRATAGTIGGVDLTMTANDDGATGRVDMEYDRLEIELLKQDGSGGRRKFLSGLVNKVVHERNLRSDPGFRHGDFAFDRRKDRSFFNYLWSGLREGMIVTALPGALDDLR